MKIFKKIFVCGMISFLLLGVIIWSRDFVYADTTTYHGPYNYDLSGNKQYRFIKIVKTPIWTGNKYVSGQPTYGYNLKVGDMVFYSADGGSSYSVSVGLNYGIGSVSLSVPTGKVNSGTVGIGVRSTGKGYYKLALNKQLKPTIMLIQYRYKTNGKWGNWGAAKVYSKSYEVLRISPTLIKQ